MDGQRQQQSHNVRGDHIQDRELEGDQQGILKIFVFNQVDVVFQSVEFLRFTDNALPVGEGIGNALKEWDQDNNAEQDDRRQHKQHVSAVSPGRTGRLPPRHI